MANVLKNVNNVKNREIVFIYSGDEKEYIEMFVKEYNYANIKYIGVRSKLELDTLKETALKLKTQEEKTGVESELLIFFHAHGVYKNEESYMSLYGQLYSIKNIYKKIKIALDEVGFIGKIYGVHSHCNAGGIKNIINDGTIPDNLTIGFMSEKKMNTYVEKLQKIFKDVIENFYNGEDFYISSIIKGILEGIMFDLYIPSAESQEDKKKYSNNKYSIDETNEIMEFIKLNEIKNIENASVKGILKSMIYKIIKAPESKSVIEESQKLIINKIEKAFKKLDINYKIEDVENIVEKEFNSIIDMKILVLKNCESFKTYFITEAGFDRFRGDQEIESKLELLRDNIKDFIMDKFYRSSYRLASICEDKIPLRIFLKNSSDDQIKFKQIIENDDNISIYRAIEFSSLFNIQVLFKNLPQVIKLYEKIPNVFRDIKKKSFKFDTSFDDGDKFKIFLENSDNLIKLSEQSPEAFKILVNKINSHFNVYIFKVLLNNTDVLIKLYKQDSELFNKIINDIQYDTDPYKLIKEIKVICIEENVNDTDINSIKFDDICLKENFIDEILDQSAISPTCLVVNSPNTEHSDI